MCCDAFSALFRLDETGLPSLECTKLISDKVYAQRYAVSPMIIDTFQHLRLHHELRAANDNQPKEKMKKRKSDEKNQPHVTKKMKKINKHLKQVMEEVREAEAVYDKEKKQKDQSETLKYVFLTYFRILKNSPSSPLVPCVLEGLAKFAHLINVDFFQDLLNVLKSISFAQHQAYIDGKDNNASTALSALHCIVAAFDLMDSIGGTLSIDLRDFYTALYTQISRLAFRPGAFEKPRVLAPDGVVKRNEMELLLSGLESMLRKNREVYQSYIVRELTLYRYRPRGLLLL